MDLYKTILHKNHLVLVCIVPAQNSNQIDPTEQKAISDEMLKRENVEI